MIQDIKSMLKEYSFAFGSGTVLTILVALLYKFSRGEKHEIIKEKVIERVTEKPNIVTESKMIVENKKDKSEELKQKKKRRATKCESDKRNQSITKILEET